jgi:hypothetical protein
MREVGPNIDGRIERGAKRHSETSPKENGPSLLVDCYLAYSFSR